MYWQVTWLECLASICICLLEIIYLYKENKYQSTKKYAKENRGILIKNGRNKLCLLILSLPSLAEQAGDK